MIEVGVGTDQRVKAGTVLLRLEPEQYLVAVRARPPEAQLDAAGQSIGASTASVATAQATPPAVRKLIALEKAFPINGCALSIIRAKSPFQYYWTVFLSSWL